MGVPMQALGAWMWSMAQTVAAMSVMWVRREVSPGVMCHPIKMSGIWESLWLQVPWLEPAHSGLPAYTPVRGTMYISPLRPGK